MVKRLRCYLRDEVWIGWMCRPVCCMSDVGIWEIVLLDRVVCTVVGTGVGGFRAGAAGSVLWPSVFWFALSEFWRQYVFLCFRRSLVVCCFYCSCCLWFWFGVGCGSGWGFMLVFLFGGWSLFSSLWGGGYGCIASCCSWLFLQDCFEFS